MVMVADIYGRHGAIPAYVTNNSHNHSHNNSSSSNRDFDGTIYSIGSTAGGRDYLSPPASPNLSIRSRDRERASYAPPVTPSPSSNNARGLNISGCRNPSSPPPLQPPVLPLPTSALSVSPPSPSPPPTSSSVVAAAAVSPVGPGSPPHSHHHYHQHQHHQQHPHHHHHHHPHPRRVDVATTSSPTALRDRDFIGAQRSGTNQPLTSGSNVNSNSSTSSNSNNNSSSNSANSAAGREREYLSMRNSILGSPRFHRRNMPGRAKDAPFLPAWCATLCIDDSLGSPIWQLADLSRLELGTFSPGRGLMWENLVKFETRTCMPAIRNINLRLPNKNLEESQ